MDIFQRIAEERRLFIASRGWERDDRSACEMWQHPDHFGLFSLESAYALENDAEEG